jgi:hypothetical protein
MIFPVFTIIIIIMTGYGERLALALTSSLLHLWIFEPPITQKSRLSGLFTQFVG